MAVHARAYRFTVAEFERMARAGLFGEDDRVELLDGEIVEMTPIGPPHAWAVDQLTWALVRAAGEQATVRVQNPILIGTRWAPQPDLVVARPPSGAYRHVHPGPAEVLLVVEVADDSLETDLHTKVPAYGSAGIPETWVVDVEGSVVHVFREPNQGGYASHVVFGPADRLTSPAVPTLDLAVAEVVLADPSRGTA